MPDLVKTGFKVAAEAGTAVGLDFLVHKYVIYPSKLSPVQYGPPYYETPQYYAWKAASIGAAVLVAPYLYKVKAIDQLVSKVPAGRNLLVGFTAAAYFALYYALTRPLPTLKYALIEGLIHTGIFTFTDWLWSTVLD